MEDTLAFLLRNCYIDRKGIQVCKVCKNMGFLVSKNFIASYN